MMRALRSLLGIRYLGRGEVPAIARGHCADNGWPWEEPIDLAESLFTTSVRTKADHKGGNVLLRMNARTGRVEYASFVTR
jgi:hypothetical protein